MESSEYGVTLQGASGKDLTMDDEDVGDIVRAIKATDVAASTSTGSSSASSSSTSQSSASTLTISEAAAKAAAEETLGGTAVDWYQDYVDGHGWVWVVTCKDAAGNVQSYYVDNSGNSYNVGYDANSSTNLTISEEQAVAAAESVSGGKTTSAYGTTTTEHGMCWYVTTVDANGNVNSYYVDNNGNAFNAEFE